MGANKEKSILVTKRNSAKVPNTDHSPHLKLEAIPVLLICLGNRWYWPTPARNSKLKITNSGRQGKYINLKSIKYIAYADTHKVKKKYNKEIEHIFKQDFFKKFLLF